MNGVTQYGDFVPIGYCRGGGSDRETGDLIMSIKSLTASASRQTFRTYRVTIKERYKVLLHCEPNLRSSDLLRLSEIKEFKDANPSKTVQKSPIFVHIHTNVS